MTFAWLFSSLANLNPRERCGLRFECPRRPAYAVGDIVDQWRRFSDFNQNRIFDGGDEPLAGFTVDLTGTTVGGGTVSTSTVTDANGTFLFAGLEAGTYKLDASQSFFNPPVGLASSASAAPLSVRRAEYRSRSGTVDHRRRLRGTVR